MQTNYFMCIHNRGHGDRIGSQLTWYICQLIYAHYNSYYIEYNEELYPNSIFTLALKKYIDEYNKNNGGIMIMKCPQGGKDISIPFKNEVERKEWIK